MSEDTETKCARWREHLRRRQQEMWEDKTEKPAHLYHYSTLGNIRSILSSRELWLFDVCTMKNDPGDGKYWMRVFYPALRHYYIPPRWEKLFEPGETLGLGSGWYDYVSCFSPADLPDQWDEFGDHGAGCALEISCARFMEASASGNAYGWIPMTYDPQKQKECAEATIETAVELYVAECTNMTHDEAWRHFWVEAAYSFMLCGTRFKEPRFQHEHEWRIFLSRTSEQGDFRVSSDGKRYMQWSFPQGVVTALLKGPNCACPDEELRAMMTSAGYPPEVRAARSPVRVASGMKT